MTSATATLPGFADPRALQRALGSAERRRKLRAFSLTLPLLLFLMLTFVVPIAALLKRAIENPEVAEALPRTAAALERWNRKDAPPPEAFAAVVADLGSLPDSADAGALARRLNSELPGARSLVMSQYANPRLDTSWDNYHTYRARGAAVTVVFSFPDLRSHCTFPLLKLPINACWRLFMLLRRKPAAGRLYRGFGRPSTAREAYSEVRETPRQNSPIDCT